MRVYDAKDMAAVQKRLARKADIEEGVLDSVRGIITAVSENKDAALFGLTKRFDGFALSAKNIRVTRKEIEDAYAAVDLMLDKMENQLRRYKEKIRNRKHPPRQAEEPLE